MNPAAVLQIITAAMQLTPLAVSTISGIKNLLAHDPNIPPDLGAILQDTADDNAATLGAVQKWLDENR